MVTDTLTVKVGYYGMAADKYVEAGTYHWTELMDNLPLHIQTGDAWDYAVEVEPMLALEDSWVAYDVGTENVRPNFNSMTTGNRFRLLSARPGIELPDTPTGPGQSGDPGQSGTSPETPASVPDSTGTSRDTERILDQRAAQSSAAPKTDVTELPDGKVMIPLTAQQAAQLLQGGGSDPDTENRTGSDSAPAEQVDDMTLALLLTGAGALLLAAAGAAAQTVYYRKERNP